MKFKKRYCVSGGIPKIGFIEEWVWAYSEQQALWLIHERLKKRHPEIVIPPLTPYGVKVEENPPFPSNPCFALGE